MERYGDTILGLWLFGIGYGIHFILLPVWHRRLLPLWSFVPLGIIAWLACVGLLLPFKDFVTIVMFFFEKPSMGMAFEVAMFMSLFLLLALGYQNSDIFRWERLKPFLQDSLFFRHTIRTKDDVFAKEEQKKIMALAKTPRERAILAERMRKEHLPLDRLKELTELEELRQHRFADAGKDEIAALQRGETAEITDMCRLFRVGSAPHPLFDRLFRMSIDPANRVCRASIVFGQSTSEHVREPRRWFRFRQDLFDFAQTVYYQDWMDRFRPFYSVLSLECYQEETDSFGLPRRTAFLRADLPTDVIEQYKDRMFIATELENVASIQWLEGDDS